MRGDFNLYIIRSDGLEMLGEKLSYSLAVLVRDQSHGNLGMGLRRKDSLGALACIAAPDTIDIQARPYTCPFHGRIAFLALHFIDTEELLILLQIEWSTGKLLSVLCGKFNDIVIKALDRYPAILIDKRRYHVTQDIDRVCYRPTIMARVKILVRSGNLYLHV